MKKIICLLSICFLFCGCYTKEDSRFYKKYHKQAEKNAVKYIQKKYDFTPIVKDSYCKNSGYVAYERACSTGMMLIEMSYIGRDFYVYIKADKENEDGMDNYQQEEVEQAIKNTFPDLNHYKSEIYYSESGGNPSISYFNGLLSQKYDGTNLDKIMPELNVYIVYINHSYFEYLKKDLENKYSYFNVLSIANFKSLDDYEKYVDYDNQHFVKYIDNNSSKYLKDLLVKNGSNVSYYKYN